MNLYKVEFAHYAQRGSNNGIKEYILANNDEEVFDYINKNYKWNGWTEREDEWDNEDQTYKEFVLENKGDGEDENLFEDLYYGQTTYSWELVRENISEENADMLIELGIVTKRQIILEKEIMQEEITRQHVINYIDSYLNKRNQDIIGLNHYKFM